MVTELRSRELKTTVGKLDGEVRKGGLYVPSVDGREYRWRKQDIDAAVIYLEPRQQVIERHGMSRDGR